MKIIYLYTLFFSALTLVGNAQDKKSNTMDVLGPVQIGDHFTGPENISVMRGDVKSIKWNTLQDKVVILDFFDTFCSTCIQSMPHLQKLQEQYGSKIQVINVTWQDQNTLEKFFAGNQFVKENNVNLPVIYQDIELRKMFPYKAAPHLVMIYKGKVQAITFNRMLTVENLNKLLEQGWIKLPLKNDFGKLDLNQSTTNIKVGVWLSKYQEGVPSQSLKIKHDTLTNHYQSTITNRSILRTLLNVWSSIQKPDFLVNSYRIHWRVKDSTRFDDLLGEGERWLVENAISYERWDKIKRSDSLQARIILNDIDNLLGIKSYWKKEKRSCLILQKCAPEKNNQIIEKKQSIAGTSVLAGLMAFSGKYKPVIDHVRNEALLEIGSYDNLEDLNKQLRTYGMEIVDGTDMVEMFVVEEKN
jgi:thiol-disulfide isomerase/thioredoxin